MTAAHGERFEAQVIEACQVYAAAPQGAEQHIRTISTDEMTGVQALERKHPGVPMGPGQAERREAEYLRHGTLTFIVSRDVASGVVLPPSCGPTRTEEDFVSHLRGVVATDPGATQGRVVVDNLNIHCSESLVRYVAEHSGGTEALGKKGRSGILRSVRSRAEFLSDRSHRIVFHYTPKHSSWLNQISIWFSILARKVLKRGNFTSVEDLKAKVVAFIAYYNQTMAKPFKWTYGKPLQV